MDDIFSSLLESVVQTTKVKVVFVATDKDPMISDITKHFKGKVCYYLSRGGGGYGNV